MDDTAENFRRASLVLRGPWKALGTYEFAATTLDLAHC